MLLEPLEVAVDAALEEAEASPAVSIGPSGSASMRSVTSVSVRADGLEMTAPAFSAPSMLFQATRVSGVWSVISAVHSFSWPAIVAVQQRRLVVELLDRLDAVHELGKSSNCVHWS